MRKMIGTLLLLAFSYALFGQRPMVTLRDRLMSGSDILSVIEYDTRMGKIGPEQALLYKVYALKAPHKLPKEYQRSKEQLFTAKIIKCGTPVIEEVQSRWTTLSSKTKKELREYFDVLPGNKGVVLHYPELDSVYETTNFKIKYSIVGPDAVDSADANSNNVPDYVEEFGAIFEECWQKEIVDMHYNPVPAINKPIEVYIHNCEDCGHTNTSPMEKVKIGVDNDYIANLSGVQYSGTPANNKRITAAHELFHAIHAMGYNQQLTWWAEACCCWMEDEVYNYINYYVDYLEDPSGIFKKPDLSLDDMLGKHEYTAVVYVKLISEKISDGIIRIIWNAIGSSGDIFSSIQTTLGGEPAFKNFFKTFVCANYLKDSPGGYIDDGAPLYPPVNVIKTYLASHNLHYAKLPPPAAGQPVPWEEGTFTNGQVIALPHLASHYIRYMKPARVDTATTLYVSFEGQGAAGLWGLMGVSTRGGNKEKFEITLDANNQAHDYEVPIGGNISEVVFIPCNLDKTADLTTYRYSLCCVPVFRAVYSPNPRNGSTARVRNLDDKERYAGGDRVRLAVTLSDQAHLGDSYTLSADFSEVDSLFDAGRVKITVMNAESNEYGIEYQLSKKLRYSTEGLPVRLKVKDLTNSEAHRANEVIFKLRTVRVPR